MILEPAQDVFNTDVFSKEARPKGISTGLSKLDEIITGFHPSRTYLIAGYSSHGKTSLMRGMALEAAKEVPVGIISLETSDDIFYRQFIFFLAGLSYKKWESGNFSKSDWERIPKAVKQFNKLDPIYVADMKEVTTFYPDWILSKEPKEDSIERQIQTFYDCGCRIIFLDYLQIALWGSGTQNETMRLKNISGKWRKLSVQLGIPMVALCQLTKEDHTKKGDDRRPKMSMIRDSGFLINDADVIMLPWRPDFHESEEFDGLDFLYETDEEARIYVDKQKLGSSGWVRCRFYPQTMRFSDE